MGTVPLETPREDPTPIDSGAEDARQGASAVAVPLLPCRNRAVTSALRTGLGTVRGASLRALPAHPHSLPPVLADTGTFIAFDKPSGLAVSPDRGERPAFTLMDLVQERMGPGVANVHRIDTGASGVVLCARTKPALDFLSGQFQSKTAGKVYLAFVVVRRPDPPDEKALAAARRGPGPAFHPPKVPDWVRDPAGALPAVFTLEHPIEPDEEAPGRMRLQRKRGGKPCVTRVKVVESFGAFALVEARAETGRNHQVRLHLAIAGAPVLADPLYGVPETQLLLSGLKRRYKGRDEEKPLIDRLALHASRLEFNDPETRLPAVVEAPLPRDFEVALKYLRKFRAGV